MSKIVVEIKSDVNLYQESMSGDKDLANLINIIERLEISARERDNELQHTREIIQRLQGRESSHNGDNSVSTSPPFTIRTHTLLRSG